MYIPIISPCLLASLHGMMPNPTPNLAPDLPLTLAQTPLASALRPYGVEVTVDTKRMASTAISMPEASDAHGFADGRFAGRQTCDRPWQLSIDVCGAV